MADRLDVSLVVMMAGLMGLQKAAMMADQMVETRVALKAVPWVAK